MKTLIHTLVLMMTTTTLLSYAQYKLEIKNQSKQMVKVTIENGMPFNTTVSHPTYHGLFKENILTTYAFKPSTHPIPDHFSVPAGKNIVQPIQSDHYIPLICIKKCCSLFREVKGYGRIIVHQNGSSSADYGLERAGIPHNQCE